MTELLVKFDPRAERDVTAAVEWYDRQHNADLGDRFLQNLDQSIERIATHPRMFPQIEDDVRRALMSEFPYAVYYRPGDTSLQVIAVLHTSRRPDYWKKR